MQNTAVITLMYLMFGQFLILTFGAFILWWVGDFSSTPFEERHAKNQAPETKIAARDTGKPAGEKTDVLPTLAHEDHSIQPQATAERLEHEDTIADADERADERGKTLLRSVG